MVDTVESVGTPLRESRATAQSSRYASGSAPIDDGDNLAWLDSLFAPSAPSTQYSWPVTATDNGLANANPFEIESGDAKDSTEGWVLPSNQRLMDALQSHTVTIQGNPGEDTSLQLYYYRFSGSTAPRPGINRINLRLHRKMPGSPLANVPQPEANETSPFRYRQLTDCFDAEGMPFPHVYGPLFETFYTHFSQHFPAISRQRMEDRFESATMSQFLTNCICALASRFSTEMISNPSQAAAPFIAKAQELIVPLTQLPTTETTSGLVLLAWASYGQGNESQLWQYSGMAIRMGMDIGIHEVSEIYDSPRHVVRTRLLFWTVFITDRIVAFMTGRPTSIPEDCVEIQLPTDGDLYPDPARDTGNWPFEPVAPSPFVYLVHLMVLVGRISNVLNGRRGKPRTLVSNTENQAQVLVDLQERLLQFSAGLPDSLKWSGDNFKLAESNGHGGVFLSLHLWSHAVLALTYHPELLQSNSGIVTPISSGLTKNLNLALASSRQVAECMVLSDLVAKQSYTANPLLIQPLFIASMAFVHEMRLSSPPHAPASSQTSSFLSNMARQNLVSLLKAISAIARYWAGVDPVISSLEEKSGIRRPDLSVSRNVFISLPDTGLLRRFAADNSHPKNIAQPTETSLQESIARTTLSTSPFWLADLMNGYTVENTSLAPISNQDLEYLLSST